MGWVMELVYQLCKSAFDNMLDGKIKVKRFVTEFVIEKNCKNAKTWS